MKKQLLGSLRGRYGHFRMESGHHGDLWFELESLCLNSREIRVLAERLAKQLEKYRIEAVCGPLIEGAFVALLVSAEMGCQFTYAERIVDESREGLFAVDYRVPKGLQGELRGKRVSIVNDVISAGSAVRGTFEDLQRIGAEVVAIGALCVLGEAIGEFAEANRVGIEMLEKKANNVWRPEDCPFCARGMPLEIGGRREAPMRGKSGSGKPPWVDQVAFVGRQCCQVPPSRRSAPDAQTALRTSKRSWRQVRDDNVAGASELHGSYRGLPTPATQR